MHPKSSNPGHVLTCNTGGASKGNMRHSSYGFCVTIWRALRFYIYQVFQDISLETNSLCLKKMIKGHQKITCEMAETIEEVKKMASQIDVQFYHIFIETNQLADLITNTTMNQEDMKQVLVLTNNKVWEGRF